MDSSKKFVIVLDVGTTNLKCHLFSDSLKNIYSASSKVEILDRSQGYSEISPNSLWDSIVEIVDKCLHDTNLTAEDISCVGLSCHRNTFITWDRNTDIPFHNLITWKDPRAAKEIAKLNSSFMFYIIKLICYSLYFVTGSQRFLAASLLKFTSAQVTGRLLWMLKNNRELREAVYKNTVMFGTLDTWLMYMLTNGSTYCTDVSCASSTGMFDPFTGSWSSLLKIIGIPRSILPQVLDTAGFHFGKVTSKLWGNRIPIVCSMADQAAALYGAQCLSPSQMKITLGTGAFLDVNIGRKPVASISGLYPLHCWKYKETQGFALEIGCHDCGTVISWLMSLGFCENEKYLSSIAKMVRDSQGVFFIPAFCGLQYPSENSSVGSGFIGVTATTKKEHLIRAVLEGIVFRLYEIYQAYEADGRFIANSIKINGGVSNNNFICQSLADITNKNVLRSLDPESSARGVALFASKVLGTCNLDHAIEDFSELFEPNSTDRQNILAKYKVWIRGRLCFMNWYKHEK